MAITELSMLNQRYISQHLNQSELSKRATALFIVNAALFRQKNALNIFLHYKNATYLCYRTMKTNSTFPKTSFSNILLPQCAVLHL